MLSHARMMATGPDRQDRQRHNPETPVFAGTPAPRTAAGLQLGHGRGASPSKPSIRVAWSHSPHHGGLAGRRVCGGGSSAGDSRAASTAYGFRTPAVFAVKAASACGAQPASSAAVTAGASLARWAAVSRQSTPRAVKNSPAGPPPPAAAAAGSASPARAGAAVPWWFFGGSGDTAVSGVP